jgi:hypothetical protein
MIACRKAIKGTTSRKHLQLLRLALGTTSIRDPYRLFGIHDRRV